MKRWVVVKDERECGDLRSSKVVVEDKRDDVLTLRNQTMWLVTCLEGSKSLGRVKAQLNILLVENLSGRADEYHAKRMGGK